MTLANRLGKATSALSGKERAILTLRARREGNDPDPDWLQFRHPTQRRQYDRYVALAYVASSELGMLCHVIKNQVDYAAGRVPAFEIIEEAAGILASDLGESINVRKARTWRREKAVSVPEFLAGLALEVREYAVAEVITRWKELRALEIVWEVLRTEFDGVDPVVPEVRATATAASTTLRELAHRYRIKRLPEPERDYIDRTWELVDQVFDQLKLVKEEP